MAARQLHALEVVVSNTTSATSKSTIMEKTTEQKVAEAILERPIVTATIDGAEYRMAPPTLATLIEVSEIVSTLPIVNAREVKNEQIIYSVLRNAKDYRKIAHICAVLLIGAEPDNLSTDKPKRKIWRFKRRKTSEVETLASKILQSLSPLQAWELITKALSAMEIGDFFAITTSLSEVNLLKPTKEVGQ